MATKIKLHLREDNDEVVVLYALMNGEPRNITGCLLEFYIKVDANHSDAESERLASDNGHIAILDGAEGIAEVSIPRAYLTPDMKFWRYDVIDGNTRNTHLYGTLEVANT